MPVTAAAAVSVARQKERGRLNVDPFGWVAGIFK
jgi:hypothetical protein